MTEVKEPHRVTIKDIASVAGVSKSAVSLALRGDAGVSEATRERVQAVANRLGYHSNLWARSLVKGSVGLIGVLLTDLKNDYHTDVVAGIEDHAESAGLGVVIANGRRDPERLASQLHRLLELRCDGIIVVSAHTPYEALREAARATPIVVVGRPSHLPDPVSNICNDDEAGARLAVEHLLATGRERIAFIHKSDTASIVARRDSYIRTMRDNGLEPVVLARTELDRLTYCDSLFASNDVTAAATFGWAVDHGRSIPGDLAVVGYDDTELGTILRPQLTSIAQPRRVMGKRAVEILQEFKVVREVFEPTLVVRGSSLNSECSSHTPES